MSEKSFRALGVSAEVDRTLAARKIHQSFPHPVTRPRRTRSPAATCSRSRRPARARHLPSPCRSSSDDAGDLARRRSCSSRPASSRCRSRRDRAVAAPKRLASQPSTAARRSAPRPSAPARPSLVATPGRLQDLVDRRMSRSTACASSSSTRPTGCSTWASSRRSSGSSSASPQPPDDALLGDARRRGSGACPDVHAEPSRYEAELQKDPSRARSTTSSSR